ncbi:hypothetical protein [Brevundimonas lutea]|uniref:hypothetical protein n=1 Tax=Brevundimonas lutea TaxID=2293980 RepID=UPI000F0138AB|nr:hypothetical protein [Brevundimonas lutea]
MSIFVVAYRIDYDTDARYDRCYADLTAAIVAQSKSKYWSEATSLYLIESDSTSSDIAAAIVSATPDFDATQDLLLVVNISTKRGHAVKGKLRDGDFSFLMGRRTT